MLSFFSVEVLGKPSYWEFPVTVCAEMQNGMDLLKPANKQTIWKKHLTFLSVHNEGFKAYLLMLVTAPLLVHQAKRKSLKVPFAETTDNLSQQLLWFLWDTLRQTDINISQTPIFMAAPASSERHQHRMMRKPSTQPEYPEQEIACLATWPLWHTPCCWWA